MRCSSCSKEKQGFKKELSPMDIKYPKLSRSATACHKKPSSEQGITLFPLPSKEFLCLYQVSFSLFFTPTRKEPCLVTHCMSFTPSLLCYCAENLSRQPETRLPSNPGRSLLLRKQNASIAQWKRKEEEEESKYK